MKMRLFIVALIGLLFQACTWVELTPEGKKVELRTIDQIQDCKKLGTTTVSLKDDVIGIKRNPEKVLEELRVLARNNAVELKGNVVVPISEVKDGKQTYAIYACIGT